MNFWAHRLRPLWEQREGAPDNDQREISVVVCNRTGNENGESSDLCFRAPAQVVQYPGKTFCGSSCSFKMRNSSGKPRLTNAMTKDEESVGLWTV